MTIMSEKRRKMIMIWNNEMNKKEENKKEENNISKKVWNENKLVMKVMKNDNNQQCLNNKIIGEMKKK